MKIVELLMRESLPQKDFFHVSEVCSLLNVKPHEIRNWEAEFPQVRAQKTRSGQRIYDREDVVRFFAIKHLLHEKKFTLAGVEHVLAQSDEPFSESLNNSPLPRDDDLILESVSSLLDDDEDEEFDMLTHQIYQRCAEELDTANLDIEASHVGEMLHDAIVKQEQEDYNRHRLSKLEYEKALGVLMQSKNSLIELLNVLEKYQASPWWTADH